MAERVGWPKALRAYVKKGLEGAEMAAAWVGPGTKKWTPPSRGASDTIMNSTKQSTNSKQSPISDFSLF